MTGNIKRKLARAVKAARRAAADPAGESGAWLRDNIRLLESAAAEAARAKKALRCRRMFALAESVAEGGADLQKLNAAIKASGTEYTLEELRAAPLLTCAAAVIKAGECAANGE
ncbi:MAG: hypothetical protein IK047_02180, partial [Clostridia bacterium]|nr:hypothetical protein [Clostridia bacterium]